MIVPIRKLLDGYARAIAWGGSLVAVAALGSDTRWLANPVLTLALVAIIAALRSGQIPLSKFSYLTQVGVVALVG
ncbi:MAG TPA: hypothetical protein VG817_06630, partial [Gemmatimonadales bacterium]|nr:hypothetical protein [Gemmatimonadales bacterium]